jgi:hypothetical protein
MRHALLVLVAAACAIGIALAGCLEPEVGPLLAGTCKNADTDPATPVSFSAQILPIFTRSPGGCGCHMPNAAGPGIGIQISGLNLGSLSALRAGGLNSGPRIVVAGQPCDSILYEKVYEAPSFGSRMPLGGAPLPAPDLELLHDWIAEGAHDN